MASLGSLGASVGGPVGGVVASVLGALLTPGVDPRIAQYIKPAIERGDLNFLIAWVNDQPPHPRDSVQAAIAGIRQLRGQGIGRNQTNAQSIYGSTPAGYFPVQTASGQYGIPYYAG